MTRRRLKARRSIPERQFPDIIILSIILLLAGIGLIMVLDASIIEAYTQFDEKYHFLYLQSRWLLIGLSAMTIAAFFPLSYVRQLSPILMVGTFILLLAVLIPGIGTKVQGASRWIVIGGIVIQPSELAKLASVIYFPSWLILHQRIESFIGIVGAIILLLLLEPDLGTSIIIFAIALSMYFASGAPAKYIYGIIAGGVVATLTLILSSPYRFSRLKTFLDPTSDPLGSSYHIRQVLISLGSGGVTGTGFGRSRQKFQYLPEATTDSIFAVIAEETGFIGGMFVISLFIGLLIRAFKLVPLISDRYAQLVMIGCISWIGIQTALNLAAMVALVPLTGVPLPFISYGGSSLVTSLTAAGLILNCSRQAKI